VTAFFRGFLQQVEQTPARGIKHDGFRVTGSAFYRLALAWRGSAILSRALKAERKTAPNHIINVSYPGLCSIEQHI